MTDACGSCGSTTWVASLVDDVGNRTCAACLVGLTGLIGRVPIAATAAELAPPERKTAKR